MIPVFISDNPALVTGLIGALLTFAAAFGLHLSQDQQNAIMGLAGVLVALAIAAQRTSVPKTPSSVSAPIQTPPPGTVLVKSDAATMPAPVPPGSVIAGPTPPTP